jgi:hypothetical protein
MNAANSMRCTMSSSRSVQLFYFHVCVAELGSAFEDGVRHSLTLVLTIMAPDNERRFDAHSGSSRLKRAHSTIRYRQVRAREAAI